MTAIQDNLQVVSVEQNEIFQKSMIREVWEETGLTIETPKPLRLVLAVCVSTQALRCTELIDLSENLTCSEEGQVYWIPLKN